MLCAYAESDFNPLAKHPTDDTWGLFQQNPRWWGAKEQILDPVYATTSFVAGRPDLPALRKITLTSDPVVDCWRVQKWGRTASGDPLDPIARPEEFRAHPSTVNYTRRLGVIQELIDNPHYFDEEPPVGGARTSRGSVWAEDLPGDTLADKLRQAWGSDDRRDIRVQHGDTLDAGTSPIQMRPGSSLVLADSRQTEFSDSGRLFVRGQTAVFDVVGDMKGARLTNIGFEGQSHLGLFAAKPTNNTAGKISYPIISGCSADTFRWIIEAPTLGPTVDFAYINNIYGPHAFKLAGSDGTWFPLGCKIDWGQSNSVVGRTALIVCTYLEKTSFGPFYMTCEGSTGLLIEGADDRTGLTFVGATIEGRNAAEMSAGALVRQRGAAAAFVACNFNYGQGSARDKGYIDADGGYLSLTACTFKRGSSSQSKASPLVARRGAAVVDVLSCREFPTKAIVTATNL